MINQINSHYNLNLIPLGKKDKKILKEHSLSTLLNTGGVIVLKENSKLNILKARELTFNCYVINAYDDLTVIKITPIISNIQNEFFINIFHLLRDILLEMIEVFDPVMAQMNGIDNSDLSVFNPSKWDIKTMPSIFTPINYYNEILLENKDTLFITSVSDFNKYKNGRLLELNTKLSTNEIVKKLSLWTKNNRIIYSSIMP
jgi:hypothetical protein